MENITNFPYDALYNNSDLLFNSYYDSSYNDSELLFNSYHNSLYDSFNPMLNFSYDFSNPFLKNHEIDNKIQIENECIVKDHQKENNNEMQIVEMENHSEDHSSKEYDDDSEYEKEEENGSLKLNKGMKFETWELAESYLDEYAKQQGFCFRRIRRTLDPSDNTIVRRRTYECTHGQTHKPQKNILEEDRRERDSEMIGCPWHINLSFPKFSNGVWINSVIGEHNHEMNPLISEIAPRFRKLTDKMLEKIKFWTIQGRMGLSTQYNLLVALFPDKVINKKDLSNAIQQFKKQAKPSKIDACQMLTELYLKKDEDPRWIIKPRFDVGERRLNSLFWMSPDQINAYGKYNDIVIIDTTSKTNQFDMILMLVIVVDNNFRNLIVAAAIIENETEATFSWLLQELKNSCDVTPITLYSDADPALISAVKKNYPETHHFHCIFHIELNLRKKLKGKLHDQFEPFHAKFLAMRNSLCPKKFETEWKKLINEFPACKQYLTKVLYPCKNSWASFAINRNFTAGIQSTQRVEVTNRIVKEKLNRSSCLTDVVGEIQRIFDQQSKKAIISECKNEIPTRGIPSIMDEYFPNLDKILREYLTPQILQKQRDQMAQSLCYDTVLIEDWKPLLGITDDSYQQEIAREDDYDQPQSLFSLLVENIPHNNILQVWKVTRHRGQKSEPQYIVLLNDGSHLCTCLWLINRGVICRHFFRVMSYSANAQFHISLIPQRWYNNNKYNFEQHEKNILVSFHIGENELGDESEHPLSQLSFQHLMNFRQTSNVVQVQGPKQKYGFGMGYAKKALDLAIRTDKENVISMHIGDPLKVQHKGRQPNRYKSCGEPQRKKSKHIQDITNITNKNCEEVVESQVDKKRERHCKKCGQPGHYAPRYPNIQ
ncbi:protein FAR1-related sequence 5-like [Rhizophagus clarus]|uniref:Protein FAR1-related sequence 5-like n=1 Tax=Rhizophagus clarus TaxID=94130 RepID=A0A8H3M6G6_9GLOM|nr:protein FAR1-related sequence 5-like [Rhizophagus clarus]